MNGWPWLNQNAWIASVLLVVAFGGAALTMAWHIAETRSSRYGYLGCAGLALLSASFILVGVSVGESPIMPGRSLLPFIRLMWLAAAILLDTYLIIYWFKRVEWKKEERRHELPSTGD